MPLLFNVELRRLHMLICPIQMKLRLLTHLPLPLTMLLHQRSIQSIYHPLHLHNLALCLLLPPSLHSKRGTIRRIQSHLQSYPASLALPPRNRCQRNNLLLTLTLRTHHPPVTPREFTRIILSTSRVSCRRREITVRAFRIKCCPRSKKVMTSLQKVFRIPRLSRMTSLLSYVLLSNPVIDVYTS